MLAWSARAPTPPIDPADGSPTTGLPETTTDTFLPSISESRGETWPPPAVTFPLTDGWSLQSWTYDRNMGLRAPARGSGFTIRHRDGRSIVLLGFMKAINERGPDPATVAERPLTVRDSPGSYQARSGRTYNVVWREGGRFWTVEADGFDTVEQVVTELGLLKFTNNPEWLTWVPKDVAAILKSGRDGNIDWDPVEGAKLVPRPPEAPIPTTIPRSTVPWEEPPDLLDFELPFGR